MPSRASSVSSTPSALGGTRMALAPARSTARTYAYGMSAASSVQWPHEASSTYVVIPTSGLATFEHPLPLVARHGLVEEALLGTGVVEVVVDNLVAEQAPRDGAAFEARDR